MLIGNSALGPAAGGRAGSGVGGALFVEPACQGASGCKAAFASLASTMMLHNSASRVRLLTFSYNQTCCSLYKTRCLHLQGVKVSMVSC